MEHAPTWLSFGLVYLAAAVVAVPLAKALGLGSIIGYLAAGVAIGPWGLGLVSDVQSILHFAEFGVVLMLFLVGLELEPRRLWAMRRPIFGWGGLQVVGCAAALAGVALACGLPWRTALVGGLALALSSTAIALQVMADRNLLPTPAGQATFSILLFQDVAAIPILALLPLLGAQVASGAQSGWAEALKALAAVALIIGVGRLLLRPLLRWIARSDTPEIFTATALLLVVATAALMQAVGLSMALGAFLAGVLLAESEYRRALETDLEPFKGLLLGLFFIAVGMGIDFGVVAGAPGTVAAVLFGFLAVKSVLIFGLAKGLGLSWRERPVFTLLLAQGGEFAFVVFQAAAGAQAVDGRSAAIGIAAVALSMALSPLLLVAVDRWWLPLCAAPARTDMPEIDEPQTAPVLIAGFGRYGQIVGRVLLAQGVPTTVLDHDPDTIDLVRRFGYRAFYGDATRLDLLRTAGAAEVKVMVVAVDDVAQSLAIVDLARAHFPQAKLVARARNVQHLYALRERGVVHIERELFESSLRSARSALEALGLMPHEARRLTQRFKTHNLELLDAAQAVREDREQLIGLNRQGRAALEAQLASERQSQLRQGQPRWD